MKGICFLCERESYVKPFVIFENEEVDLCLKCRKSNQRRLQFLNKYNLGG